MRKPIHLALLTLVLTLGAFAAPASACPNCKDSIGTAASEDTGAGGPSAGLPGGFNTSVHIMLTAFIGVLGFVGFTLYRGVRGSAQPRGFNPLPPQDPPTKGTKEHEEE